MKDSTTSAKVENAASLPTVTLRGLGLHAITEQQAIAHILNSLDESRGGWVVTPNLDILRRYDRDASFRKLIEPADLFLADGMPLIWASRLQRQALPERVTGSNLIHSLTEAAASAHRRVYLLGGEPGTAEQAGGVLAQRHAGLVIAGHECPEFGFDQDEAKLNEMQQRLIDAQPDIVYVALGCPKQERLIVRMREHLPCTWWLGVGISFSFVTGHVRRAPVLIQRLGLEWAHRLVQEPRRLGRRYLIEGLPFAAQLLAGSLRQRLSRRSNGVKE